MTHIQHHSLTPGLTNDATGMRRAARGLALALALGAAAVSSGCTQTGTSVDAEVAEAAQAVNTELASKKLSMALAAQPADHQARYSQRHPAETLEFFGIEPGMTVAEALPGGGWYTKILAEYLGGDATLYGVNYQDSVWSSFGWSEDRVKSRIAATAEFPAKVAEWNDNGIAVQGFTFGTVPAAAEGTADAVLFIRALHNLGRFRDTGVLDEAVAAAHTMLKPGGIVGVVQHRAPENAPDAWAIGSAGYLKTSAVMAMFTKAGFVLDGSSEVNANPNDKPDAAAKDIVWRLPPNYALGPDTRAAMDAIGESDRMTLRFRKAG